MCNISLPHHQILIYLILLTTTQGIQGVRVHFVHWNTTNANFFQDNYVIDINVSGGENQQANIICPFYPDKKSMPRTLTEQYVIYNVTREEFDSCQLMYPAKIVALCNTPYLPNFYTLTFRSFSPIPGAFEFYPGRNYYFISTDYLQQNQGQLRSRPKCNQPPMKLVFRILQNNLSSHDEQIGKEEEVLINRPKEMPRMTKIYDPPSSKACHQSISSMLLVLMTNFLMQ